MRLPPRLWHFLASKRTHRALLIAPFALMVLATLAYVAADKWGEAKLEKQIAALKAEGIPVTLEEAYGQPPAAEDDVFQHPALVEEFSRPLTERLGPIAYMGIDGIAKPTKYSKIDPDFATPFDIRQWATDPTKHHEPASQVAREWLVKLQPYAERSQSITPAFERPVASWVARDTLISTQLISALRLTDFSKDLALVQLAADDCEAACRTLRAMTSTKRCFLTHQPCLLSLLVTATLQAQSSQVIWQGIAEQKWGGAQLVQLQKEFNRSEIPSTCVAAIAKELAWSAQNAPKTTQRLRQSFDLEEVTSELWNALKSKHWDKAQTQAHWAWIAWRPPGLNSSAMADHLKHLRQHCYTADGKPLAQFRHADFLEFQKLKESPELSGVLGDTLNSGNILSLATQSGLSHRTRNNLLQCGIALERYRLKYGKHPDTLAALAPEFLTEVPKDVCDGQPLRYKVLPDGAPHVWSLWPSGKDEGGMPHQDPSKGNAVWTTGKIPGLTKAVYTRQ